MDLRESDKTTAQAWEGKYQRNNRKIDEDVFLWREMAM